MVRLMISLWKRFWKNPDQWLLLAWMISMPFSIRKVVWFLPLRGTFNEYADISIFLSDIIFFLLMFVWVTNWRRIMEDFFLGEWNLEQKVMLFAPLGLALLGLLSVLWASNGGLVFASALKIIEGYGIYMFVVHRVVSRETLANSWIFLRKALRLLALLGFFEAIWGAGQFLLKRDFGWRFLKESSLGVDIPGVAKIIILDEVWVRAYGSFPHPNILGGFLGVSILCSVAYMKLFHVKQGFVDMGESNKSTLQVGVQTKDENRETPREDPFWSERGHYQLRTRAEKWLGKAHDVISKAEFALERFYFIKLKQHISLLQRGASKLIYAIRSKIFLLIKQKPRSVIISLEVIFGKIVDVLISDKYFDARWNAIVLVQAVGLVATFSKSAWLGVALVIGVYLMRRGTVSRGKDFVKTRIMRLFGQRILTWKRLVIVTSIVFGMLITSVWMSFFQRETFLLQSFRERLVYQEIAMDIVGKYPILGISCGQMVVFMEKSGTYPLFDWQMQPVHNVFLLIWVELGLFGFVLFSWWMLLLFEQSWIRDEVHGEAGIASVKNILLIFPFVLLPPLLFDHYLWDIQQGQDILWLACGLCVGVILQERRS